MKFDLIVNAPMEPRVFRVVTVINGVPCISVTKLDTDNFPRKLSRFIVGMEAVTLHLSMKHLRVWYKRYMRATMLGYALSGQKISPQH